MTRTNTRTRAPQHSDLTSPGEVEEALVAALRDRIRRAYSTSTPASVRVSVVDLNEIADRMVAALPDPATAALDAAVGPFYDTAGLSRWLGVSRQAVHKRIGKSLIAVHTEENDILYPAFQFTEHGDTLPHLMDAARTLSTGLADEWSIAMWLNTPVDDLAGRSIVECLRAADGGAADGGAADVDAALAFARAEASRLAA